MKMGLQSDFREVFCFWESPLRLFLNGMEVLCPKGPFN